MKHPNKLIFTFLWVIQLFGPLNAQDTPQYEWDLSDIYADTSSWQAAIDQVSLRIEEFKNLKGSLGNNAQSFLAVMREYSDLNKEAARVYVYTSLQRDADQREPEAQARFGLARQMYTNLTEGSSWINPELLKLGEARVNQFFREEPALADYEFLVRDTLRQSPHTLDEATEAILAQASMVLSSPSQIYQNYANADIPWPEVTLNEGRTVLLNQSGYSLWRGSANREDRKLVFDTFWQTWQQYADGMGATLASEVQSNVFSARVRNHEGVLANNLFDDGLPPEIYTQLVAQVNDALPTFHRYLQLRGRMLGIEDLRYYDIYPPLVNVDAGVFDLKRSQDITFEALRPFGEEYLDLLDLGLKQDWMHSHPQPGKRSGAYMNGSVYDVHPYVLLNHNDDYEIGAMIFGKADTSQLGGPIRIAKISGQVAEFGVLAFISMMAYISISLGLVNLFPIPMLDGGHLMFYAFEKVLGRPLSQKTQEGFFRIGLFLLLSLMFFTTFNDLKDLGLFK